MLEQRRRFAALFAADDRTLKANLRPSTGRTRSSRSTSSPRNVAPGSFWLRRVWQTLAVLARGPAGAREVVETPVSAGADIARLLQFPDDTVQAIRSLDEHWDGAGKPYHLERAEIPLREGAWDSRKPSRSTSASHDERTAFRMARARRERVRPCACVTGCSRAEGRSILRGLGMAMIGIWVAVEPADIVLMANDDQLDLVC